MKASGGQQQRRGQPDVMEFVPKPELERAQQQIEKQKLEIERLQQENDRLRKELEAALRAGKRQAPGRRRGPPRTGPPGRFQFLPSPGVLLLAASNLKLRCFCMPLCPLTLC